MPRKPKTTQPEKPNEIQGRDLFRTPNYATELLIPFIPERINFIWECASYGDKIANILVEYNYAVTGTDLKYGDNFFETDFLYPDEIDRTMIITNPPFSLKRKFYERCMKFGCAWALLIPADYCGWIINAIRYDGCEKIIPDHRIDYITPTGLSGASGHTSYYHSMWLTWGLGLGRSETFVSLTREMKNNI